MLMEIVPRWEVSFSHVHYFDTIVWTVNGDEQLIELIEIFTWNNITEFEVKRING